MQILSPMFHNSNILAKPNRYSLYNMYIWDMLYLQHHAGKPVCTQNHPCPFSRPASPNEGNADGREGM